MINKHIARGFRVADVFRRHWNTYQAMQNTPAFQRKAVRHILNCRTARLGGHLWRCDSCGHSVPVYNSCRDRHCPTCQTLRKEKWLDQRRQELLPVTYFHLVFTLPHELNPLILHNRRLLLNTLFSVVNRLLQGFAADERWRLQGKLGFLAVLHTWSQQLMDHFHLHCVVPGGVWREQQQRWVYSRQKFLFRKDSMAKALARLFIEQLQQLHDSGTLQFSGPVAYLQKPEAWAAFLLSLRRHSWIVYAKRPFAGPEQVLEYLGRYTHRVAISDYRILSLDDDKVSFSYRDRQDENQLKSLTLHNNEFIRRFLLHILPQGFQKIRFFGWMAHNTKTSSLLRIRAALQVKPPSPPPEENLQKKMLRLTGKNIRQCPLCLKGTLIQTAVIAPQPPDTS
jgi:hypothetical protein